ncbi:hypothetical protein NN561_003402 [Cricetulus griseus]
MCYKSGEYYRFHAPPDVSSSKSVAPTVEKELEKPLENGSELQEDVSSSKSVAPTVEKELEKPLENGSELQEGDGLTVPTKFSLFERPGEAKTSLDRKPRTDIAAFENGGGDCYAPQRIIFLGVNESEALAEVKDITSKCSNVKAGHTPNPKHKMSYHHHNKNRNAENASYMHVQRDSVRTVTLNTPPRSRPTSGPYNKDDVNKEPKLNLCPEWGKREPSRQCWPGPSPPCHHSWPHRVASSAGATVGRRFPGNETGGRLLQLNLPVLFRLACLFLKQGADLSARDTEGRDTLTIAMETANADIVTL